MANIDEQLKVSRFKRLQEEVITAARQKQVDSAANGCTLFLSK